MTKKILFSFFGSFSLLLGVVGIFVPLLPTVPFVLLSAYLYAKGFPGLYQWLKNHRFFGGIIRDYSGKNIPSAARNRAIAVLWASVTLSCFVAGNVYVAVFLLSGACLATIFLLRYKSA